MKFLLFADLHLDTPFRWASAEVGRARRRALIDTLKRIVDVAIENQVDALCSAGDLFEHDLVAPDTHAVLRNEFARLGDVPVLLSPGNHDWFGPQSVYTSTSWTPNVHVFDTIRLSRYPITDGISVWGGAHDQKRGTPGFLDDFKVDTTTDVNLALFHGSLRSGLPYEEEGKEPHAPFDEEQVVDAGFVHAMVGHFHTPKMGPWHTYPGNPEPLAFGETGDRGAVLVEVSDDGRVTQEHIPVSQTMVTDLRVKVDGSESRSDVRDKVEAQLVDQQGIVRVTVEGTVASDVDVTIGDLDGVGTHLDAVVIRLGDINWDYKIDHIATFDTVQGQFVREVREVFADLDDPVKERRVLITGLRALEGRKDLAVY